MRVPALVVLSVPLLVCSSRRKSAFIPDKLALPALALKLCSVFLAPRHELPPSAGS